ncbi:MAG TPA: hypothetical protein VG425_16570, partial [Casimicrobiaceae bacterium]|nr:hypothetical protein [Casimicrobiaceae bacterium]
GYVAAGYAAVVIVFGTLANLNLISEIDSPADGENIVVWGNFFTLVMFAALTSVAGAVFLGITGIGYHILHR